MVALLHIGKTFSNYDDLRKEIDNFEKVEDIELWVRDSRTVNAASKRARRKILNPSLVYAELTYACVFGGRKPSDRNKEKIHSQTSAKGCPYKVRFSTSNDGQSLVVKEMHTEHNHDPALKLDRSKRRVNRQGEPKRRLKRSASFEEFSSVSTDWVDPFGASKVPRLDSSAVSLHPGAFVANSFTTSRNIVNGTQFNIVKNFDVLRQVPADFPRNSNVNIQFSTTNTAAIKQEYNIKQQLSEFEYQRKDGLNDAESNPKLPCRTPSCDTDSRSSSPVDGCPFHSPMSLDSMGGYQDSSASLSPFSWEHMETAPKTTPLPSSDELADLNAYLENNISLHASFESEGEAMGCRPQLRQSVVKAHTQHSVVISSSSGQGFTPVNLPNKHSRIILPAKPSDTNNNTTFQMHRVVKTESSAPMQLTRSGYPVPLTPPEESSPPSFTPVHIKKEPFEFPVIKSEPDENMGCDLPFVEESISEMSVSRSATTPSSVSPPIIKKENGQQPSNFFKIPCVTTVIPSNSVKLKSSGQKVFKFCSLTNTLTTAVTTNTGSLVQRPVIATTASVHSNAVKKPFEGGPPKHIISVQQIPPRSTTAQTCTSSASSSVPRPFLLPSQPPSINPRPYILPPAPCSAPSQPRRAVGPLKVVKTEKIPPPAVANPRVIPRIERKTADVLLAATAPKNEEFNLLDDKDFGDLMSANFDSEDFNDINNLDSIIDDSLMFHDSIPAFEFESISVV